MSRPPSLQKTFALDAPLRRLAAKPETSDEMNDGVAHTNGYHRPLSTGSSQSRKENRFSYTEQEIDLVMYYLDHLFPRLCPFFKYKPVDNGRGWLLNLFLRTKPLCNLAVCISACDKTQLVHGPLNESMLPHVELELQHVQIIVDLRDHLRYLTDSDRTNRMSATVEALACIMHLVLFELWIPRKDEIDTDWVMHMEAASILLDAVAQDDYHREVETRIEDFFPVHTLSAGQRAAFEFFYTQFTYCFCLTVVSIGLTPALRLSIGRTRSIFRKTELLKNMLGCHDDVMLMLLDIATLRDSRENSGLSSSALEDQASQIAKQLEKKMETLRRLESIPKLGHEADQAMITRCFVSGALVYLQTITLGFFPNNPAIKIGVAHILEDLERMRSKSAINIPSWPYCIAGCLAQEEDYHRIRALNSSPVEDTHPLVMTKWTLDIIQECWRVRETTDEGIEACDWVTAMNNLGTRLMLG